MNELKAMKIAQQYAAQHFAKCNIVWYAGEKSGWHFVWLKNTSMPRYTGFGNAIKISPSGEVVEINNNAEIHQISKSAIKLHDGHDFSKN